MNLMTIICTLLIFGVLISTHEFGHFIVAKKCGVIVEEFSIGMGPLLFHTNKNGTEYSLRLLPIGGYCKMYGEDEDEESEGSLNGLSPLKRILVYAAGAIMNLLSAIVILMIVYTINGTDPTLTMDKISPNSPALKAGVVSGDTLTKIDGKSVTTWDEASSAISKSNGKEMSFTFVTKSGSTKTINITPTKLEGNSGTYKIGITPTYTRNFAHIVSYSFKSFFRFIYLTFSAFIGLFRGLVGIKDLSGPIGVASVVSTALNSGFIIVLNLSALLAINIGIFNLLPIPALDGSKILFCLIELIKGSPIDREKEGMIHFIGFVCLMAFALFIAFQDITKLF